MGFVGSYDESETDTIYVERTDRFVVSLIVSYDDDLVKTPEQAAAAALELTRDDGSGGTQWFVFDRKTRTFHQLQQSDFEGTEFP